MHGDLKRRKDQFTDSEDDYNFAAADDGVTISHKLSAAKEENFDNNSNTKDQDPFEMKSLKVRGTGMTNWWLMLSFFMFSLDHFLASVSLIFTYGISLDFSCQTTEGMKGICAVIDYLTAIMNLGKGICCVSALCICFGYYTFCFLFGFYQSPCPQLQLLHRYKKPGGTMQWPQWVSLELFFCLDFFVHVFLVYLQYVYWKVYAYKSIGAVVGAFFFHRMWSFVYSEYKTIYFLQSELVYGWHSPLPPHVMIIVYSVETLTMGYFVCHLF